jgi:hypothetical protein
MTNSQNALPQLPKAAPFYEPQILEAYVLEIYVPQRLSYLPRLYTYLKEQLSGGLEPEYSPLFRGYSLFEAKGAFAGTAQIYEEPTLVIQLIFDSFSYEQYDLEVETQSFIRGSIDARIMALANEVIQITRT